MTWFMESVFEENIGLWHYMEEVGIVGKGTLSAIVKYTPKTPNLSYSMILIRILKSYLCINYGIYCLLQYDIGYKFTNWEFLNYEKIPGWILMGFSRAWCN